MPSPTKLIKTVLMSYGTYTAEQDVLVQPSWYPEGTYTAEHDDASTGQPSW